MQKIRYNQEVDALLIEFSKKPIDHAEEEGPLIIHFAADGEPVLLEIFDAKQFTLNLVSSVITGQEVAVA